MFEKLADVANANPNVRRLGRTCSTEFAIVVDDTPYHVVVREGRVVDVLTGPFKMRGAAFRIAAAASEWREFLKPAPRPGRHDIFAMSASGAGRIEGDMNVLLNHLAFFKALLATMRAEA